MGKVKENITILAIGDKADYDSYSKLNKEKRFILQRGFEYININYRELLSKNIPPVNTKKIIIFFFFPFRHWDQYIEHKGYKGIYGNRTFHIKFERFWDEVARAIRDCLPDKRLFFINPPRLCGLFRDKLKIVKKFSRARILQPKLYRIARVRDVEKLLVKGRSLFLKPRYGSMGKGITVLSWSNWQTNFIFKNDKIISQRSDHGWKFRSITGNRRFLSKLLRGDILIEEAIDSVILKRMKIDMRIYIFLNKVIYIYPRKNKMEKLTTNISQGGKGDPRILRELPGHLIKKAEKIAARIPRISRLNFAGADVMIDRNLKDVYILDVNVFPGFPKRGTFNLATRMIEELAKRKGSLRFEKGYNI